MRKDIDIVTSDKQNLTSLIDFLCTKTDTQSVTLYIYTFLCSKKVLLYCLNLYKLTFNRLYKDKLLYVLYDDQKLLPYNIN